MNFRSLFFSLFLLLIPLGLHSKPPALTPRDARIKVDEILRAHASHHTLNQELVQRTLENFFHELDPNFSYLLEPEILKWTKASPELLTSVLEGYKKEDFSVFEEAYEVMIKAIQRRRIIEKKDRYLNTPLRGRLIGIQGYDVG